MQRITYYIGLHAPGEANTLIQVEDRARDALALLGGYYDALTVTRTVGMWQGEQEPSLRVEVIIGEPEAGYTRAEQAQEIAREIARTLNQDAVGLSIETLDSFQLITKD